MVVPTGVTHHGKGEAVPVGRFLPRLQRICRGQVADLAPVSKAAQQQEKEHEASLQHPSALTSQGAARHDSVHVTTCVRALFHDLTSR
jgi:hypothetical protein